MNSRFLLLLIYLLQNLELLAIVDFSESVSGSLYHAVNHRSDKLLKGNPDWLKPGISAKKSSALTTKLIRSLPYFYYILIKGTIMRNVLQLSLTLY